MSQSVVFRIVGGICVAIGVVNVRAFHGLFWPHIESLGVNGAIEQFREFDILVYSVRFPVDVVLSISLGLALLLNLRPGLVRGMGVSFLACMAAWEASMVLEGRQVIQYLAAHVLVAVGLLLPYDRWTNELSEE